MRDLHHVLFGVEQPNSPGDTLNPKFRGGGGSCFADRLFKNLKLSRDWPILTQAPITDVCFRSRTSLSLKPYPPSCNLRGNHRYKPC